MPSFGGIQRRPSDGDGDPRTIDFMGAIKQLFNNIEFSDLTIQLGKVELPAHQLVLTAQSDYFSRALSSGLKEANTRTFQYNVGSMHAYWRCFKFMYTGEYDEEPAPELAAVPDDDVLLKHVRVYELANYFGVGSLKLYSLKRFKVVVGERWTSGGVEDCIHDVYRSTVDPDCEMRKTVVEATYRYCDQLWGPSLEELVRGGGDFAVDLVMKMM